jgi:hypothetical protein
MTDRRRNADGLPVTLAEQAVLRHRRPPQRQHQLAALAKRTAK